MTIISRTYNRDNGPPTTGHMNAGCTRRNVYTDIITLYIGTRAHAVPVRNTSREHTHMLHDACVARYDDRLGGGDVVVVVVIVLHSPPPPVETHAHAAAVDEFAGVSGCAGVQQCPVPPNGIRAHRHCMPPQYLCTPRDDDDDGGGRQRSVGRGIGVRCRASPYMELHYTAAAADAARWVSILLCITNRTWEKKTP